MPSLRAAGIIAAFFALTVPLLPVQYLLLRLAPAAARTFPNWYHRRVCALFGVRVHVEGEVSRDRGTLLVSNHVSWLDIPVLSAVAPLSFIAKKEVASWPFVSWLAKLQRSVFVDRERRTSLTATADEIAGRIAAGDHLVLFAEGTSNDGNGVLPFRTSLFGAVMPRGSAEAPGAQVQTLALAYTHRNGLPLDRRERPGVAWYGDMELAGHIWALLKRGPLDARVTVSPPLPLEGFADRKALARDTEAAVRRGVARHLARRAHGSAAVPAVETSEKTG